MPWKCDDQRSKLDLSLKKDVDVVVDKIDDDVDDNGDDDDDWT